MNINEYEGYEDAYHKHEQGTTLHELRLELLGLDLLTEEELDCARGAYRFIQEREEAGDE